jgi:hypothetical protein
MNMQFFSQGKIFYRDISSSYDQERRKDVTLSLEESEQTFAMFPL